MPAEDWEIVFKNYLIRCAHAVAADLKETDSKAEARGRTYETLAANVLFCPECWVRNGEAIRLRPRRWHMGCGEHDYRPP